ncbi:TPA: bifunctional oligoribonuclease/PAP phosphatase NrnA [Streptococcus equi subsp. zooepidemicus]|uniref:DHH subfamily 1 protein n=1 Tax=Streptococcus equi subsp. zooepidemicus (strain MGCS10565) TaxID=552526 RepID=B4U293_STREM|nr:bifunctional oligoribonuclease/PAP phosphatase NrnA [Streptococcus equi]HEL1015624.1 bifunctional oligoribonuclease/PAP phosphatase NrnA [Streptococcus equi subsp. ruminatorum]ACG62110.1 DHH subfamily 1 protein [Streptococcus equi subsp. zooepidemicus MGCS10565]KIS14994.1 DHH subfamily 1 protein [Streptococcus equi subsp. zooepidemicus SzAM60]MCD3371569.1 bifunctional oligoribonuclease/PAP phosphatase NrnA [Streptococcus equi subsp. zooepidemicus]MCD3381830.1 bifunctional oligoribonuclease/
MTTFQTILEHIKHYQTIIIHRHQNPDPDALGSQAGLKEIIRHNFPDKKVLITGFDEPSLAWISLMDQVSDADYKDALVIVTDTANRPRIDDERYTMGACLIKIDHHPNDDVYGDLSYVDTKASSASEIIAEFAFSQGLALTDEAARLLYTGIVGDTGRFLYASTSSKTLAIASQLRNYAFDFAAISRQMDSFPLKIAKLQGYVFEQLDIDDSGAARLLLSQEVLNSFGISLAESSAIVSAPGKIDVVQAWVIFVELPDGQYRVRMRSKEKVINGIAKRHQGGGHPLASGATSSGLEENEQIYQELIDLLT